MDAWYLLTFIFYSKEINSAETIKLFNLITILFLLLYFALTLTRNIPGAASEVALGQTGVCPEHSSNTVRGLPPTPAWFSVSRTDTKPALCPLLLLSELMDAAWLFQLSSSNNQHISAPRPRQPGLYGLDVDKWVCSVWLIVALMFDACHWCRLVSLTASGWMYLEQVSHV